MTHTLGKVPVGGDWLGFHSPWQLNQMNNTAEAGPGPGWWPVQPRFPLACPGNRQAGDRELRALEASLLPLPWGGGGGPGCRKLLQSVSLLPGSPQDTQKTLTAPTNTRQSTTGVFPTPYQPQICFFIPLPALSACQSSFRDAPSLSLVPLPQSPRPASAPSPLSTLFRGQRLLSLLSPEWPPWCPQ